MVDDFEAALAAADSTPTVEEVIEPTTETAVDVIEEENDEVDAVGIKANTISGHSVVNPSIIMTDNVSIGQTGIGNDGHMILYPHAQGQERCRKLRHLIPGLLPGPRLPDAQLFVELDTF